MLSRMLGALRLNVHTYEEVENDTGATLQAMGVVILVSIAYGIGLAIDSALSGEGNILVSLVVGLIARPILWAAWALIAMLVGTTVLKTPDTHADWGQMARCTGFAQTPSLFNFFVFIPIIGGLILLAAWVWQFIAMIIAVRQSLDFTSTWRAFGVVLIGGIPYLIIHGLVFWLVTEATKGLLGS